MVVKSKTKRVTRGALRGALLGALKQSSGRKDIKIRSGTKVAVKSQDDTPIEERAGFPVKLKKGCVHPKNWTSGQGVKIHVDFARASWLPDDWGQGLKITQPTSHSTGGGGGILTAYVAPDGKNFFHKQTSEEYCGKQLTREDGWNGQVRLAKAKAKQHIALCRLEAENGGLSKDASLFKVLSAKERACLPNKDELHVGVISARRATKLEGVQDIFMVEYQFRDAGVAPTWYVDEGSLKDYRALGLTAVVGGKLTPARNKALADARKLNKVCVQVSDDISCWEYRHGPNAAVRTDDAANEAHAKAKRLIVSPVAAARFMVAKMRGAEAPQPKLAGVYMLGSCARTFSGDAFARQHFILGDFFCAEPDSKVNFDNNMTLKEDYDFACSHIAKYGSVMRCNRLTLSVKHYDNGGGACTNRDKKGLEEQKNIGILQTKWPGCFRANPKRKNEVIMRWKGVVDTGFDDDECENGSSKASSSKLPGKAAKKPSVKKGFLKKTTLTFPPKSTIVRGTKDITSDYIKQRVKKIVGKTAEAAIGVPFKKASGEACHYKASDLTYDIKCGYVTLRHRR